MRITKFDENLIWELQQNCRVSNSSLARKLKCTNRKVTLRIKDLEKEEVIIGYHALVDIQALTGGFTAITAVKINPNKITDLIDFISNFSHIRSFYSITGEYDIEIYGAYSSRDHLEEFLYNNLGKIDYIRASNTRILLRTYYYGKIKEGLEDYNRIIQHDLDPLYHKILESIKYDARVSAQDIANRTNTTSQTVGNRIKNLEKMKIIRGYRAIINPQKLGFKTQANINLKINPSILNKVIQKFTANPQVMWVDESTGRWDLHIQIYLRNPSALRWFIREFILKIDGIQDLSTTYIMRSYRRVGPNKMINY